MRNRINIQQKILKLLNELEAIDENGSFYPICKDLEGKITEQLKNAKMRQFCENMSRLDEQSEDERIELIKLVYKISKILNEKASIEYFNSCGDMKYRELLKATKEMLELLSKQKKKKIQPRETTIETLIDWFVESEKIAVIKQKANILAIKIGIT